MPDTSLCRLVVSGPLREVQRFIRAAAQAPATPRGRVPADASDDLDGDASFEGDMEFDARLIDVASRYWTPARRRAVRAYGK